MVYLRDGEQYQSLIDLLLQERNNSQAMIINVHKWMYETCNDFLMKMYMASFTKLWFVRTLESL